MNGKIKWKDVADAVWPAIVYTLLANAAYSLLAFALKGQELPGIVMQALSNAVCLLYFCWCARKERLRIFGTGNPFFRYPAAFCYVMAAVAGGVACNCLISLTGLMDTSAGYRHVSEIFYGNGLAIEALTLCVLGPLTEELVYRGFVFQRLAVKADGAPAILISALLFGILHLNVVQGVYAFVMGLLFGWAAWKTNSLATTAAAHMAVNLAALLWTETDWLDFLNQTGAGAYGLVAACLALMGIFLMHGNRLAGK